MKASEAYTDAPGQMKKPCNARLFGQRKNANLCIKISVLLCEMTQKLIQFPAIVLQYPFRFAMDQAD